MSKQYPHFGEVVNGLMWDGTEWVPVDGLKPGDVIGEMMWTGTHWVPIDPKPTPKPAKPERPLWQRWWFILILAFTFLSAVDLVTSDDPAPPPTAEQPAPVAEEPEDPGTPGLDDPVVDGDLEFTVTDVDTGASKIPGTFNMVYEAEGSYTLVDMTVKNVGDNPAPVRPDHIGGTVSGGEEISSSWVGSYYANPQGQAGPFIRDVNPGAKIEVTIVFDVPDGVTLQTVVCHDSVFSDGAVITL